MPTQRTTPETPAPHYLTPAELREQRKRTAMKVAGVAVTALALWGINKRNQDYSDHVQRVTGGDKPPATAKPAPHYEYYAEPGDTAWGIAERVQKAQGTEGTKDIRPLVDKISDQAAHEGSPQLDVGDKIDLPVDIDHE